MPVEIKELVIRTVVSQGASAAPEEAGASAPPSAAEAGHEEVVEECVRQVLRILARNRER